MIETRVVEPAMLYKGVFHLYRGLESYLPDRLTLPLGIYGVSRIHPQAYIDGEKAVHRMLLLVNERSVMERFVATVRRIPADSCCVDIGAGAGAYTLLASTVLTNGISVAVEPDPECFNALLRNLSLNKVESRTSGLNIALGNRNGRAMLHTSGYNGKAPRLHDGTFDRQVGVRMYTLDYLVAQGYVPIPQVVKIDVEGAEGLVLKGMKRTLTRSDGPSDLFIEFHRGFLQEVGENTQDLKAELEAQGFREVFRLCRNDTELSHFTRSSGPL